MVLPEREMPVRLAVGDMWLEGCFYHQSFSPFKDSAGTVVPARAAFDFV